VTKKRVITAVVPVIVIAGVAGAFVLNGRDEKPNGNALEYAVVEMRDMEILAEAAGQIEPIRVVEVKSKASGDVLRVHVDTGDEVPVGTLLAEIDPRDVRNAYAQADADIDVARARLTTAEAQKARIEELRRANVVTEQELENSLLEEANARANYIKARTNLELASERLGDVTIRAPINGTIISKQIEVGQIIASASQNISGGTTLFLMADLSEMQVRALIDETDLGRVEAGMPARVHVEAFPGRTFRGSVLKIEPQAVVEQNVTMFPVLVRLDNRDGLLRPGMNADVQVEVSVRPNAIVVPNAAVVGVRDAIPAGAVLGLSEERMQVAMRGALAANGERTGAQAHAGETGEGEGASSPHVEPGSAECQALMEKVRDGGGFQALGDEERAKLRECRPARGEGAASPGGAVAGGGQAAWTGGMGGGNRPVGAAAAGRNRALGSGDMRPGIVFVASENGQPEPRRVMLGVNDWDNTEILSGLEPGERVVMISVARLQQQQAEFQQRIRERMGGPLQGGGGAGPIRR
jgi:HlyD family secretion protein